MLYPRPNPLAKDVNYFTLAWKSIYIYSLLNILDGISTVKNQINTLQKKKSGKVEHTRKVFLILFLLFVEVTSIKYI